MIKSAARIVLVVFLLISISAIFARPGRLSRRQRCIKKCYRNYRTSESQCRMIVSSSGQERCLKFVKRTYLRCKIRCRKLYR